MVKRLVKYTLGDNMNLEKLASLSGVSLGTVSKAFSGSKEISEKTRQKIFNIAKEQGCFDKYYSIKREVKVIAVICPEAESQYCCAMLSYLEREISKMNAIMTVSFSKYNEQREMELIAYHSMAKDVDGIIIISAQSKVKFNKDIPIVAVNTKRDLSEVDCVNTAFAYSFSDTVDYLTECGHKKIAFIYDNFSKGKQAIFVSTMQKKNLTVYPEFLFCEKKRFEEAGYSAMEKIYKMEDKPTAIFCAYDNIALGAIQTIRMHGDNVPNDFSVVGIDDIPVASHYNVSLTTIHSNLEQLCSHAVDLMFKKLDNKFYLLRQKISLRSELIIRNTVRKIN